MFASSHTRHAEGRTARIATDRRRRRLSGGAVALLAAALLLALPASLGAQTLVLSEAYVEVMEPDTEATYTVALSTKPTAPVTVTVTSSNTDAATVDTDTAPGNQNTLTFTLSNWSMPQDVIVTAKDDDVDNAEGGRFVFITHTPKGGGVSKQRSLLVVVRDDEDTANVVLTEADNSVIMNREKEVTERGAGTIAGTIYENTNTYYVKLDTEPTGTVAVAVASSNTSVVTVSPESLTFTPQNWESQKPVTVTGVDDRVDNPDDVRKAIVTHTPSGGGYDDVSPVEMSIKVRDIGNEPSGEVPALLLVPSALTVDEGDSATYRVSLKTQPTGNVRISIGSLSTAVTWSPETSLTFTPSNYSTPQTVTVTSEDNDVDAENLETTLDHTPRGGGYAAATGSLSVTVTDDDERGLIVTGLPEIMSESATERYKVRLATEPTDEVTVTVGITQDNNNVPDSGPVTVDTDSFQDEPQSTLMFTKNTWSDAQEVVIAATDDSLVNPGRSVTITHTVTGVNYTVPMVSKKVSLTDNEVPNLKVVPTDITVVEGGVEKSFTVSLEGGTPSAAVSVAISALPSGILGDLVVAPPLDANSLSGTVNVSVLPTPGAYPDRDVIIKLAASTGGYDGQSRTVTVTVEDADKATWLRSTPSVTVEEGKMVNYGVTVTPAPATGETVTVTLAVPTGAPFSAAASGGTNTVNLDATASSGTFAITGIDDGVDNDSTYRTAYFTLSSDRTGDETPEVVTVRVRDIHTRGLKFTKESGDPLPSTIKVDSGGTENIGGSESYLVKLMSAPAASGTVTVTVVSSDPAAVAVVTTPSPLTFTDSSTAGTITVTGKDIGKPVGSKTVKLTHTAEGADYETLKPKELSVRVTATADTSSEVIDLSSRAETVEEVGAPKTYKVKLLERPAIGEKERVVVTVASSNTSVVTVSPKSLTFTLANWNKWQTVTWRAVPRQGTWRPYCYDQAHA